MNQSQFQRAAGISAGLAAGHGMRRRKLISDTPTRKGDDK